MDSSVFALVGGILLAAAFLLVLFLPAWCLAGRIENEYTQPFFRALVAVGLSLAGYVSFVNLVGRVTHQSTTPAVVYLALNLIAMVWRWRVAPAELSLMPLLSTARQWIVPVLLAVVIGIPEWVLAVSTPYWDEVASSALHLTAVNQFAENLFPPRHNALPDIPIKYHYGSTMLAGTVRWLTGLSANVSIDVVGTGLWLFTFLFVYFWLRSLLLGRAAAVWGGVATLFGGGLSWLYLPSIEVYSGITKTPEASELQHKFDSAKGWLENLVATGKAPSLYLRNADGSLSNLPWDIAPQFQQHATALGIALTVVALALFARWRMRQGDRRLLLALNIVVFGVLCLAHAVFGAVAAVTAGLWLLVSWARQRTWASLVEGAVFGAAIAALTLMHGGLFATGAQYGASADVLTFREHFGYSTGGAWGFLHWNIAGFGLLLVFTVLAWARQLVLPNWLTKERNLVLRLLTIFTLFAYLLPHLAFYSSQSVGVEEFTEISKFFFAARFGFALISAWALASAVRTYHWALTVPAIAWIVVTPLTFCYASVVRPDGTWLGFYNSPYPGAMERQMGATLNALKKTNHDTYFDASGDEFRYGYLSEMLVYGGSVFTLTPSRYEQTGVGYRLSETVVGDRYIKNSRMTRLQPGAAEECACGWYYSRPVEDAATATILVRGRFQKMVDEKYLVQRDAMGTRVLYSIEKPTTDLDNGIDRYWRPRLVSQTHPDWDGDGKSDLIFFDYANRRIVSPGKGAIDLPDSTRGESVLLYTGKFPGEPKVDFLVGRMKDTIFHMGKRLKDLIHYTGWGWNYRDSATAVWQPEYEQWQWEGDIVFVGDLDKDGFDSQVAYVPRRKEWILAPNQKLSGPQVDERQLPVPFGGRFLEGSRGDLALWSLRTGMVTLQSINSGQREEFKFGGRPGDVMVPGDYNGDGVDEIAIWQQTNQTWYWRKAPNGPMSQATFGTASSVPLPADYNNDGRLDLAYWEPNQERIFVSFSLGQKIDLTITVPSHTIPAFVNMY